MVSAKRRHTFCSTFTAEDLVRKDVRLSAYTIALKRTIREQRKIDSDMALPSWSIPSTLPGAELGRGGGIGIAGPGTNCSGCCCCAGPCSGAPIGLPCCPAICAARNAPSNIAARSGTGAPPGYGYGHELERSVVGIPKHCESCWYTTNALWGGIGSSARTGGLVHPQQVRLLQQGLLAVGAAAVWYRSYKSNARTNTRSGEQSQEEVHRVVLDAAEVHMSSSPGRCLNLQVGQVVCLGLENHGRRQDAWNT